MEHELELEELRADHGEPTAGAVDKESDALNERTRAFVAAAPFLVMATTAADGSCDASPKGGPPGFVKVLDDRRILVPEFSGNRRFDGFQNLLEQPHVGLLLMIPGITETLRINGVARLTRDRALLELVAVDARPPWFGLDIAIEQVFHHCSKAFLRSGLWAPERWPDPETVPSPSRTIARRAREQKRSEVEVRREVEREYEPELY
jgi:PPOX class probable FMN-dependent enzyme